MLYALSSAVPRIMYRIVLENHLRRSTFLFSSSLLYPSLAFPASDMSTNYATGPAYQYRKQGVTLLLLLLNLTGSVHSASAACYFPDGSIAAQDTPCSSNGNSTCCGNGYACL